MIEPTSPKFRVLNPNKLVPPEDVFRIKKEKLKAKKLKNPIYNFFYVFFCEGF